MNGYTGLPRVEVTVVEDLCVKGMDRNKHLAKHVHDASWAEFVRQWEYKPSWCSATVVRADRFYPSSKTCSDCGPSGWQGGMAEPQTQV